jgi:hypothetical protein
VFLYIPNCRSENKRDYSSSWALGSLHVVSKAHVVRVKLLTNEKQFASPVAPFVDVEGIDKYI